MAEERYGQATVLHIHVEHSIESHVSACKHVTWPCYDGVGSRVSGFFRGPARRSPGSSQAVNGATYDRSDCWAGSRRASRPSLPARGRYIPRSAIMLRI